jgi:LuxR family transcriptional regulator, maltose regulon positive regulatory protein
MAATAEHAGVWDSTPLTKFRIPRVRRDAVPRPDLLARLTSAVATNPITVVSAPGGYGKSTLLTQFTQQPDHNTLNRQIIWLAIDSDDNDSHRLFAALLRAVEPLGLAWESDPRSLLANAAGSASQQRASLAALVNALCTATAQRIVLVLDDFHRIESASALTMIESLIERLPDHVSILIGTRLEPQLPLARWRVHGELAEFTPEDLQFSEGDAIALALARAGIKPDALAVRDALQRTHGWAAGLSMLLQSRTRLSSGAAQNKNDESDRHLFAYLAQEILADLSTDLQQFMWRSSVLSELNPELCRAVTGRDDARDILEDLYRRNLFLTAIDEQVPVLRFHDLFRDFLHDELERREPSKVATLHELAGRAESSTTRAISHFLQAHRWDEAIVRIVKHGEAMLIEGGHATLERWIDAIPQEAQANHASVGYLRGVCAWLRWDWPRAKAEFGAAVSRLNQPEYSARRLRCLFMYVDALSSSGDTATAAAVLDEIAAQPLQEISRAQLALQRAWHAMPTGEPKLVGQYHDEFIAHVEKNPTRVVPATTDLIHCVCIGMPAVARSFDRFYSLAEQVHPQSKSPWKFAALAVGVWAHFWHGRRDEVERLLQQGEAMQQRFGSIRMVVERLIQFKAQYLGAIGKHDQAIAATQAIIASLQAPEAAGHRAAWLRAYMHGLARQYWQAMNSDALNDLLPQLLGPRRPAEWPFIDAATETARGQALVLAKKWPAAQAALETAVRLHARYRMPITYGDPRIALAYTLLMQGDKTNSTRAFVSVYEEVINDQAIGLLLLEPRPVVITLLESMPLEMRRTTAYQTLIGRLELWGGNADKSAPSGPLTGLSEREVEVLAQVAAGASNKHIARDLSLSLHTVKRHIANILDKLDCASRGQAADVYRRSAM